MKANLDNIAVTAISRATTAPSVTLLAFPPAGGNAAQYLPWRKWLPAHVSAWALTFPGRQHLYKAEPIPSMQALVEQLQPLMREIADSGPYILLGHSMGGLVAHAAATRQAHDGRRLPTSLVVVASGSPDRSPMRTQHLDDDALLDVFVKSIPSSVRNDSLDLDDPKLREMILRPLRADLTLLSRYRPAAGQLDVPIVGLWGRDDRLIGEQDMRDWADYTSAGLSLVAVDGSHFFPREGRNDFISAICGLLPVGSTRS